ncbi:MAG: beta-lactamase family protein [Sphingomonas sp.]|uniref:serine hydrolase domain-containing protein n=1 Tax=Sphingomonas sp. TaxID=28214 RepID=UPI0025FEAF8C|nr:serine hydrolase domain-containing protein [Sphingomonas sp.]MBY0282522.1 beta-lactamase family protein [Sphingomonas sp.]
MLPFLLAAATPLPASAGVRFERNRVVARIAEGEADRATHRAVTADDPVRVASISKLAVALAVMRLVERGTLDLDRDVSTYLGWTLRNPAYPDAPVTLRRLLSHTSGVRDAAGYGIALDGDLTARMAEPGAWDAGHGAGYFAYANLNYPLIAAVMEGATATRFDRIMAEQVFAPLKIAGCFNWSTCTPDAARHAVVLYRAWGEVAHDDLHGRPPACPGTPAQDGSCDLTRYRLSHSSGFFSPQGGMRIAPTGLARIGAALARPGFLSRASLATMTQPQWRYDGHNGDIEGGFYCAFGLGVMFLTSGNAQAGCRDALIRDGKTRIGHAGEAYGLRSGLWVDPATGRGIAFYTTAVADDAPTGRSAYTAREEAMAARVMTAR